MDGNMNNGNTKRRITKEQKLCLVKYLEEHSHFAHGTFLNDTGAASLSAQWKRLAVTLNSLGGATKDGAGWKKACDNMKGKVKQKSQDLKNNMERTGRNGIIPEKKKFTDLDERAIGVISEIAIVGQTEVGEPLRNVAIIEDATLFASIDEIGQVELPENADVIPPTSRLETFSIPPRKRKAKRPTLEDSNEKLLKLEEEVLKEKRKKNDIAENQLQQTIQRNDIEKEEIVAIYNLSDVMRGLLNKP